MEATVYIGIKLDWDYVHIIFTFTMPNDVRKALHIFKHIMMGDKEYPPHICAPIQYGQKIQYTDPLDAAEYLSEKETNLIQQVCGTFLYYSITFDNTFLPDPSEISLEHSRSTKSTVKQMARLLIYLASNPIA